MKSTLAYLAYILEHKYYVFLECWKFGLIWQGIVHDMSKFSFREFQPYKRYFIEGDKSEAAKRAFEYAWNNHQKVNRHHWQHWIPHGKDPLPMPQRYVLEMIADWRAMSIKFGNDPAEHYQKKRNHIRLHPETRAEVERILLQD